MDWPSEDWDGTKAKAKEQTNSWTDNNMPKPWTDVDQMTDVDKIPFSKLQIRQNNPKEKLVEVAGSLLPPPMTKALEDTIQKNDHDDLSEAERKQQQEEEKYEVYQRTYMGQLSEEEESDTESDYSVYSYFG